MILAGQRGGSQIMKQGSLARWKMEAIEKCDVMVYMKIFKFPYKFWHCGPEKEFFICAHEWRGYYSRPSDSLFNDHRQPVPQRPRPPHFFPENHHSVDNSGPFVETQRMELSYLPLYGVTRQSCQAILATHGLAKSNLQSYLMILEKKFATKNVDAQAAKRTRSPPIPSAYEVSQENSHLSRNDKIQGVLEAGVCPRLVELLLTVGNIVNGDDAQTESASLDLRNISLHGNKLELNRYLVQW
ncbi:unnamed protein product [Camellia sinensis]